MPDRGSGVDIKALMEQLILLERCSLSRIHTQINIKQAQISTFLTLKKTLSTLEAAASDLSALAVGRSFTVTSSNENVLIATVDPAKVQIGSYDIQVESTAFAGQFVSDNYRSKNSALGLNAGIITVFCGYLNIEIFVDGNTTLTDICNAIENHPNNNFVIATIINSGSHNSPAYNLILTAREPGVVNDIALAANENINFISHGALIAARDAVFYLDGVKINRPSNMVNDVIDGVSFSLKDVSASASGTPPLEKVGISIVRDELATNDSVKTKVEAFVDVYNSVISTIAKLDSHTLSGDTTLRSITLHLRGVLEGVTNSLRFKYLSQLGIKIAAFETLMSSSGDEYVLSGKLVLDSHQLFTALESDFDEVFFVFTAAGDGVAARIHNLLDDLMGPSGLIDIKIYSLEAHINNQADRMMREETRLKKMESRLLTKYHVMDILIYQMKSALLNKSFSN